MKMTRKIFTALAILAVITSCSKEIALDDEGNNNEASNDVNSTLTIKTRANDGETVSYPVNIYVFDANGSCVGTNTIADATSSISMKLQAGTYKVCAIAGADDTRYSMPTQDEALSSSVATLNDGQSHADIMAMTPTDITMTKGATNSLTIALNRKVNLIQNIALNDLPETATAVAVTLSPLYHAMKLDGTYNGTTSAIIPLEKMGNGKWTTTGTTYLLPSIGTASISIAITEGDDTKTYAYTIKDKLDSPNHKVNITGTYISGDIELTGTIKGTTWNDDINIAFNFSSSDVTDTPTEDATIPNKGTFYNDNKCFIVNSVDNNDGSVTLTLMTTAEKSEIFSKDKNDDDVIKATIDEALKALAIDGLNTDENWRLPTRDELLAFKALIESYKTGVKEYGVTKFLTTTNYCFTNASGEIRQGKLYENVTEEDINKTARVRAFTTVTLKKSI